MHTLEHGWTRLSSLTVDRSCGSASLPQEAPLGASMANRRGAAGGMLQIDPILQPNWAAKHAEREALEKKQLAVIMASKSARAHRVGGAGGDDHMKIVMRQPSTMADRFALPSHLSKQLGQVRSAASRRRPSRGHFDPWDVNSCMGLQLSSAKCSCC